MEHSVRDQPLWPSIKHTVGVAELPLHLQLTNFLNIRAVPGQSQSELDDLQGGYSKVANGEAHQNVHRLGCFSIKPVSRGPNWYQPGIGADSG